MERLTGQTPDIAQQRRQQLQELFPECFSEGKLLTDRLLELCGLQAPASTEEHYELIWKGKRDCLPLAMRPSSATLRPVPEESLNFESTHNVFIEGDNLEVLKLLQRSYHRRIKLIYIDPPYNTGRDFVYADDFRDPLQRYRETTSQQTKSNAENAGRFHTNYLNMMYPRLRLAANLLSDDGLLLISIDDGEVSNLRKVADEIFGEDNFVCQFVWTTKNGARGVPPRSMVMSNHEYIIAYARNKERVRLNGLPRSEEDFSNPDNDPRGLWRSESIRATGKQDNYFTITDPQSGREFYGNWAFSQESIAQMIAEGLLLFPNDSNGTPRQKKFIDSYTNDTKATVTSLGWHSSENATEQLIKLFEGNKVFDFPKPQSLLTYLLQQTTKPGDTVLDFFAGSGSTGEALMRLNAQNQGERRFILVQLPECIDATHPAAKLGFSTISSLACERLKRVSKQLQPTSSDCGFRLMRLDSSGFKHWDNTPAPQEELFDLYARLHSLIDRVKPERQDLDIAFELILQVGLSLDAPVQTLALGDLKIFDIGSGQLVICLQKGLTMEIVERICERHPRIFIAAEECFADSANLANAGFTLQQHGIEFKLV